VPGRSTRVTVMREEEEEEEEEATSILKVGKLKSSWETSRMYCESRGMLGKVNLPVLVLGKVVRCRAVDVVVRMISVSAGIWKPSLDGGIG
jgi:hypothetical protein